MVYAKYVGGSSWIASTAPGISAERLNNLETQYDCAVVIGEIKLYSGTTAPTNFFMCNGTSKSNITYNSLFLVSSYQFGGSSTWFNLPNLMGKFVAGFSTDVGDYDGIGDSGGSETVTLASSQMPVHTHSIPSGSGAGTAERGTAAFGTANSGSAGEGESHENRPPFVVLNYIIRYA